MQCPYCLSEVSKDAFVCKACARDIYMFKELLVKIDELEAVIKNQLDPAADTDRIATLETIVDEPVRKVGFLRCISDIALFIVLPLALLLIAHALITVVYDTKMVYLRIISMAAANPNEYARCQSKQAPSTSPMACLARARLS